MTALTALLPDWLPWWGALAIAVPVVLYALALLMIPFSVIGLKGRMEGIEARLDAVHAEIRGVAIRLPEVAPIDYGDAGRSGRGAPRPPIPIPAREPPRSEPRLNWPRPG